ncbi:hypothetical protein LVJ82_08750 [Vitreoscilla massiliensis]|uniref:Uncharacterized protein n=1 Tax=Vitreoscilla massiliensis TaxID=1689272 RepID=A0ABY4E6F6_9NEIS|nr:hypothetical protein [Vitreoscilla massiliensis]UOO91037.1 hypothetical protein LVJ82_08750 [Vitreoscilla massiliensis]
MHKIAIAIALVLSCLGITPAQAEPRFPSWLNEADHYPARAYGGAHVAPKFTTATQRYRKLFRTMYRTPNSINYAGEYVLEFARCGSGCAIGLLYNARTGATQLLPTGAVSPCTDQPNLMMQAETRKAASSSWLQIVATTDAGDTSGACYTKTFIAEKGKVRLLEQQRLSE